MVAKIVRFLRDAPWLTEERLVAYSWLALIAYGVAAVLVVVTARGLVDAMGRPLGTDFSAVWAAGVMALEGHAADVYDWPRHAAVELTITGDPDTGYYGWHYPPIFLFVAAALALLPYGWALLAWMAATAAGYVACVRCLFPHRLTVLVALAFPAVLVNLGHGQNGFFSTALLGAGLLLLETRPALAGILLGILCYKPQMVLLLPFALAAGRHWRALLAMAATLALLSLASVAVFGSAPWQSFVTATAHTSEVVLEGGAAGYFKMVTVLMAVRVLGGDITLAWLAQGAVALVVTALVVGAWRAPGRAGVKAALLVAAILLVTPYAYDYDLVILAIPLALLAREAAQSRLLPWEGFVLTATMLLPALARGTAWLIGVPVAPAVALALVAVCLRRLTV